jgi:hypothetical protein
MSLTVYGSSDDLIEIEGDISEEFTYAREDRDGDLLAFSDGTLLRIEYCETGIWRIAPVVGGPQLTIEQATESDDANYSDRAILSASPRWVVQGIAFAQRREPSARSSDPYPTT